MSAKTALTIVAAALIALGACSKDKPAEAPKTPATATGAVEAGDPAKPGTRGAAEEKTGEQPKAAVVDPAIKNPEAASAAPTGDAPTVKLISAGGEPKQPLRLKATKGGNQSSEMTMKMAMEMGVGGQKIPMKLPAMKMGMKVGVTDVNAAGDASYTFTIDSADVVDEPGAMAATVKAMKDGINGVVGMTGDAVVTNRGYTKSADFKMPPNVAPQMRQMMDGFKQSLNQMSTPLPAEAVGPGATWQVIQSIEQNGMKIDQTATFELIGRTGDIAKTKFTIVQSADPQEIKTPDMPPGMSAKLLSLTGNGSGTTTLDLTKIMPTASTAKVTSSVKMSTAGQQMDVDMTIDMALSNK